MLKKVTRMLLLVFLSLLVCVGQASSQTTASSETIEQVVQEAEVGRQILLEKDKMLVIKLEANPSTGYRWTVESMDKKVLKEINAPTGDREPEYIYPDEQITPGAPCTRVLRFVGVSSGRTSLKLVYKRPWEKNRAPVKSYHLDVQSKGEFTGTYVQPKAAPNPKYVPPQTPKEMRSNSNRVPPPAYFDWYDSGVVTWVKDQGTCGSCWAFGASAVVESAIFIADNMERDLSEQFLVSCNDQGSSCAGGWWTYDYFIDNPGYDTQIGAVYESDFPYYAYDAACSPPYPHHEKLTGWGYIDDVPDGQIPLLEHWPTVDQIKQKIYDHGPVGTVVCSNTWTGYTGGIFYGDCSTPTHIVAITGWDDAQGVFFIKNSWGSGWGEGGYMRLPYNYCMVGYQSTYALYGAGTLADFSGSPTTVMPGGSVQFTDLSAGTPTSWSWSFPGGTPSTSTVQNPVVVYNTVGTYDVTLTATNAQGTNTVTKTAYITVSNSPPPPVYCSASSNGCDYEWIEGVQIGAFTNTSGAAVYTDFTNLTVDLVPGEVVQLSLTPGFYSWSDPEYWTIWIDWNKNGDFNDPGEEVFHDWSETVLTGSFTVPADAGGTTRMRIAMSYNVAAPSCGTFDLGEVEDYTVSVQGSTTNQNPVAVANGPYSGVINTPVNFSSAGSYDPDGTIASYFWDFGDHATSTTANPSHTYTVAGTYTARLTVTDDKGATAIATATVTITDGSTTNQNPVAMANGPYSGIINTPVNFTSAGSYDPDGTIASYFWDFGDHTTSTAADPNHTYTAIGTYTVRLIVTDDKGATGSDTAIVTITDGGTINQNPVAVANGPYSGIANTPVNFSSTGSNDPDGTIVSYFWDFGDHTTSTAANPSHAYTAAGNYTARLTVTDDKGAIDIATAPVTITRSQVAEIELINGQPLTVSGTMGEWQHFFVNVPAGSPELVVQISGGSGDMDLYTRLSSRSDATTYDCRPYIHGNTETCTVMNPQAGRYFVSIHAYLTSADVQLQARY